MAQQAIVTPPPAAARPRRRAATPLPAANVPPVVPRQTRPAPKAATPKAATPKAAAAATKDTAARETRRVKDTATTQARQVKATAAGQTKAVARTAQRDVQALTGSVRSQAQQVKGELTGQVRDMLSETEGQLREQADAQANRLAGVLSQVGGQAVALSEGRPAQAGPLVEYAEQAANWLDTAASHIEERGLDGLATDVVDFARRRPAVFLAGAAVVGFGVGRLIRSGAISGDGDAAEGWDA
jgi:hypothetical protein